MIAMAESAPREFVSHQEDPLLKFADVARLVGVDRKTVQKWVQAGILPVVELPSGMRRIRKSVLLSKIEKK